MKIKFYIIPFLLLLFSCSKEKSKKWIIFDLDVVNSVNGEPAPANFYLSYYTKGGMGEDHETTAPISIGGAVNGKFEKVVSVPKSSYNHVLKYRSSLDYIPVFNSETYSGGYSVSNKHKNEFVVKIKPVYNFGIKFNNINCFDSSDSLWLTQFDYDISSVSPNFIFVGCGGGEITNLIEFDSIVDFKYVVKKNGQFSQYSASKIISWDYSTIVIEY